MKAKIYATDMDLVAMVTGNTFEHKEKLRECGFKFAKLLNNTAVWFTTLKRDELSTHEPLRKLGEMTDGGRHFDDLTLVIHNENDGRWEMYPLASDGTLTQL